MPRPALLAFDSSVQDRRGSPLAQIVRRPFALPRARTNPVPITILLTGRPSRNACQLQGRHFLSEAVGTDHYNRGQNDGLIEDQRKRTHSVLTAY